MERVAGFRTGTIKIYSARTVEGLDSVLYMHFSPKSKYSSLSAGRKLVGLKHSDHLVISDHTPADWTHAAVHCCEARSKATAS